MSPECLNEKISGLLLPFKGISDPKSFFSLSLQKLDSKLLVTFPEVLSSLERLSQATGGMEKSWYRCIFPFGIISLVIGIAGTGVTYTYNDLPQTKVVSVVLLVMGIVLLMMATACWTLHKKKRRKKKEGESLQRAIVTRQRHSLVL
uniref:Transmembrane protein 100 n=1 Tax=Cyprinodon variegatus TaxID=28743 RepID=A0A3Q2E0A8_CYPVA